MTRIPQLNNEDAPAFVKRIFKRIEDELGTLPNLYRILGHSPESLNGFLELTKNVNAGILEPRLRKAIILLVSELSGCRYCVAMHNKIATFNGIMTSDEAILARKGEGWDEPSRAALEFAGEVYRNYGKVPDSAIDGIRQAGFDDAQIVEIVATIAMINFSNLIGNVAQTELDSPEAPEI